MKTNFQVALVTPESSVRFARLEVDLPFAPSMEMQFDHPVWKEGRKPVCIEFDLEQLSFFVQFEQDKLSDQEALKEHCETYKYHGWTFRNDP
jgi:hypothetical protein